MTLREAVLERPNSLNVVRLFLAVSVLLVHTWPVSGSGTRPEWVDPFAVLAVPGFFCLSGFLIARSRMRLSWGRFLWHRSLRILPGLWVVLVLTAFVAAPLSLLRGGTWSVGAASGYVLGNALLAQTWSIPGTIGDGAWNGSLWTLFYEFLAYLCAGALLWNGIMRRHPVVTVGIVYAAAAVGSWSAFGRVGAAETTTDVAIAHMFTCFFAGMALFFVSDRIPVDGRWAFAALVLLTVLWQTGLVSALGALPLAYLLLWVGCAVPARWAPRHDISYGMYIYAFPVQVMLEWFLPWLPVAVHLALSVLITTPLAFASWVVVERPSMRLRRIGRPSARRPRQDGPAVVLTSR